MNKEIEKIKQQSKAQIDSIYEQLDQAQQEKEKENVEKRLLIRKLDTVITEAARYFDTNFNTIDDVLNAFSTQKSANNTQTVTQLGQSSMMQSNSYSHS